MRLVTYLAFLTFPAFVSAQHAPLINTSSGPIPPSNAYRYGNILYPGGISNQIPATHTNNFPSRLGGTVSGTTPYTGVPPGYHGGPYRPRTVVVPYAYPVFYGGGYYMEPQQPNVTVVVPQQPVPQVIINNSYVAPETGKPVVREYAPGELPETNVRIYEGPFRPRTEQASSGRSIMDDKPTIFLIALKDGTVRQALGYWVQDDALHYVTPNSSVNHVSVDMVDRARSIELNAERKLDFDIKLPR